MAPITVLLADDQALFREGLHTLLSIHAELQVVGEASNGEEALRLAAELRPQVVLMDVQMPVLDGLEATRRLCARYPSGERPRIIGMTANAMPDDIRECETAGMDECVVKPVAVAALIEALKRTQRRAC